MKAECENEKGSKLDRIAELEEKLSAAKEKTQQTKEKLVEEIEDIKKKQLEKASGQRKNLQALLDMTERKYRELDHESVEMDRERGRCKGENELLKKKKANCWTRLAKQNKQ